jgi:hypothetical protein
MTIFIASLFNPQFPSVLNDTSQWDAPTDGMMGPLSSYHPLNLSVWNDGDVTECHTSYYILRVFPPLNWMCLITFPGFCDVKDWENCTRCIFSDN